MTLTFGSLFAGIGGFDKGFGDAGMRCAWQVEIDAAARGVLARQSPNVPRYADIRDCGAHNLTPVDVICGGFPCQDLSVAGRRGGLAGARSGLFYEMTRITDELRPMLLVWENVSGLLSSNSGRDFASVLVELERIGYSGCWTTLDAQWFGVAQRRQRVFGVFARRDIGAGVCAEILSLAARLPWNTETRGKARQGVAATIRGGSSGDGVNRPGRRGDDQNIVIDEPYTIDWMAGSSGDTSFRGKSRAWITDKPGRSRALTANRTLAVFGGNNTSGERAVASALTSHGSGRYDFESENFVCGAQSAAEGGPDDNSAQAGHVVAVRDVAPALTQNYGKQADNSDTNLGPNVVLAFTERTRLEGRTFEAQEDLAYALTNPGSGGRTHSRQIAGGFGVRRLTPLECERLQGFDDGWTGGQSDSTRYRQLGNAVAVPCARWLGRRIRAVLTQ